MTTSMDDARRRLIEQGILPALDRFAQEQFLEHAKKGRTGIVESFLEIGMPVNVASPLTRKTPLLLAVEENHTGLIRILLDSGANMEARDGQGNTALLSAVFKNHAEAAGILIAAGANLYPVETFYQRTPLFAAVSNRNPELVSLLLRSGVDVNHVTQDNLVALGFALKNSHKEIAEMLINAGADVNTQIQMRLNQNRVVVGRMDRRTVLMDAIACKQEETIDLLIRAGADLNASNSFGWTPWMIAIDTDQMKLAKRLEKAGAQTGNMDRCAFTKAAAEGDVEKVRRFIEAGISVDAPMMEGDTALMLAARAGRQEVVSLLLAAGASVSAKDACGRAALDHACEEAQVETARILIGKGSDVNNANSFSRQTPLMSAADKRCPELTGMLLEAGADPNARNWSGWSALASAASFGDKASVLKLLGAKADPNILRSDHSTPLFSACVSDWVEIAQILLDSGADTAIRRTDLDKDTAFSWAFAYKKDKPILDLLRDWMTVKKYESLQADAEENPEEFFKRLAAQTTDEAFVEWVRKGSLDVVAGLLRAGKSVNSEGARKTALRARETALMAAVDTQSIPMIDLLLGFQPDLNAAGYYQQTVLMMAAETGNMEIVERLLSAGADVNAERSFERWTALHYAASKGHIAVMDRLAQAGARINPHEAGWTPLICAAWYCQKDAVRWLLQHKAEVDTRDPGSKTALIIAVEKKSAEIAELLLKAGAQPDLQDEAGKTALMFAVQSGNQSMVRSLLSAGANTPIKDHSGKTAFEAAPWMEQQCAPAPPTPAPVPLRGRETPPASQNRTTLMEACLSGSVIDVESLLESGADPNSSDDNGWTPLRYAAQSEHFAKIALHLLDAGAQAGADPAPLMAAVQTRDIAAIRVLRCYGADPNAKGADGISALDVAGSANDPELKEATEKWHRGPAGKPWFSKVTHEPQPPKTEDWQEIRESPFEAIQQLATSFGNRLLAAAGERVILVWDLETGKLLRDLPGHHPIVFSPNGKSLAYAYGNAVRLLNVSTGDSKTLCNHSNRISALAFNSSGFGIASADQQEIRVMNAAGTLLQQIRSSDGVTALAFSPERDYLISGGANGVIRLLSPERHLQFEEHYYHRKGVGQIILPTNPPYGAARETDFPVRIEAMISVDWNRIKVLNMYSRRLYQVFASPSRTRAIALRRILVSGGDDECIHIWSVANNSYKKSIAAGSVVNAVAISNDTRYIIAGCEDGRIRIWDALSGEPEAQLLYFGNGEWAVTTAMNDCDSSPGVRNFLLKQTPDPENVRAFLNLEQGSKSCRCHLYARRGSEFNPDTEKSEGRFDIVKFEESSVDWLDKDWYSQKWHCVCKICGKRWFVSHEELGSEPTTWLDVTSNKEYDWVFEGPKAPSGLIVAATNGAVEEIKTLLARGADVDEPYYTPSPIGMKTTALMFAVYKGHPECVELLLEAGADPNAKSADGDTPLILAARQREDSKLAQRLREEGIEVRIARMLLQKGADPAVKNNTALRLACQLRYPEMVKLLVEAAGPKAINDPELLYHAMNPPHKETIELLLDLGVDVNARRYGLGDPPLMQAVNDTWDTGDSNRREVITELLLNRGADVNAPGMEGNTALMIAARAKPAPKILTWLLQRGADVKAKNKRGETALHFASFAGCKEHVEILLENGAEVEAPDCSKSTPLIHAMGYGKNLDVVKILLDHGANIEAADSLGGTALILAAKSERAEIVNLLLDRGAKIDAKSSYGRTALMEVAIIKGSEKMVKLLIQHGADVNLVDSGGETALVHAAMYGHRQIVKLLLDHNADTHGAVEKAKRYDKRAVAKLIQDHNKK